MQQNLNMPFFWFLATCDCGLFAPAEIEYCLYCIGGDVLVNHQGCPPVLTRYHEPDCPNRALPSSLEAC